MQKANQNKKLIKLMSGILAVLTISTPASLATKPIPLEDKPGILEKIKSFALPAAIIGGAVIITGATIYGISKIKESKNKKEFNRSLYLALQGVTNRDSIASVLEEIEKILESKIENSRMDEFKLRFEEFKTKVQTLDDINAAKRELSQGLHAIVKTFNVRFDINEFNRRKSNKSEKEQTEPKKETIDSEIKVQPKIEKNESTGESNKSNLPNEFKVFKIAVIGSDIRNGNEIVDEDYGEEHSLNKFTVDKLCSSGVGELLSNYAVAGVANENDVAQNKELKNEEIELYKNYPERLPINSILINRKYESVVLSFYYIDNCDEAERIIPECQYAICPFFANMSEQEDELKNRLTRLRDFVKHYNKMCDVRFLYYIDRIENTNNIGEYSTSIGRICRSLYTLEAVLQQDIQSHRFSINLGNHYNECIDRILNWREQRAKEFKRFNNNKKVLKINRFKI